MLKSGLWLWHAVVFALQRISRTFYYYYYFFLLPVGQKFDLAGNESSSVSCHTHSRTKSADFKVN